MSLGGKKGAKGEKVRIPWQGQEKTFKLKVLRIKWECGHGKKGGDGFRGQNKPQRKLARAKTKKGVDWKTMNVAMLEKEGHLHGLRNERNRKEDNGG